VPNRKSCLAAQRSGLKGDFGTGAPSKLTVCGEWGVFASTSYNLLKNNIYL
jgi:hypothetical protein